MEALMETTARPQQRQDEGIDLVRLFVTAWRSKYWILSGTVLVTLIGLAYALLAKPVYMVQAIIAPKEVEKGGDASRLLSQFGGMGGMMATQLGLGNANLDKMEILLKGHELAESLVVRHDLLPVLFPAKWDSGAGAWIPKDSAAIPTVRDGVEALMKGVLKTQVDAKKNILKASVEFRDPRLAKRIMEYYLSALNDKIRNDVRSDAERNHEYLGRQMDNTLDPILREKIQNMIAFEIEKIMLVSTQSFEVLEKPVEPRQRSKPDRKLIVVLSFVLGAGFSVLGVFAVEWLVGFSRVARELASMPSENKVAQAVGA